MSTLLDLRDELQALDVSRAALRRFGLAVGGVFAVLGGLLAWKSGWSPGPWTVGFLVAGGVLMLFGLMAPRLLGGPYRVWMAFALALGVVMSRVLLTLFFFLVLTPVGWVRRTFGDSPVRTEPDPSAETYWQKREDPADPERLKRMW